jgi:chromate transporter
MIYLQLFLTFLKIGAVSFGGGYGMISLIREDCLANAWLTESELLNFIAVAESTPGPIAVNMATFVGSSQAGFFGSLLATLGVVLPSFIIILLIATLLTKLLKYAGVKATLGGIRPAVVGMILATAVVMFLNVVLQVKTVDSVAVFDWKSFAIFCVISVGAFAYSKWKKKAFSPIVLIILSGVLGVIAFGV